MIVHVIGANGRSGVALCRSLMVDDIGYIPIVRDPARWQATGLGGQARVADLTGNALGPALANATHIVSCAHARHIPAILAAAPPDAVLIALGSTRKFTRWPDAHGNGVLEGERALLASGRPGVILHPTESIVIAGGTALPYADFVRAVAAAAGLQPPRIVPVPAALLLALSPLTRLPVLPRIEAAEIRRLLENKSFDTEMMRLSLRIEPIPLEAGLTLTFGKH
jgi:nucleoside-diphosphate-sugar epimerase